MANYNISDLSAISALADTDLIEVLSGGVNYKGTVAQFKAALGAGLIDWNMSTNAFPTGGKKGQEYYGIELTTRTTLTDTTGALLPSKVLAKALQDNPTTNAHFAFTYVIF